MRKRRIKRQSAGTWRTTWWPLPSPARRTGLGLSIARWISSTHGGVLRAEKNKPRATAFIVRLEAESGEK